MDIPRHSEALAAVPLFSTLTPDDRATLAAHMRLRHFARNRVIFHKDDPGTTLFILLKGEVKLILPSARGEEAELKRLHRGDYFGELALLDKEARSATAITITDTDTLILERDDFLTFVQSTPQVVVQLFAQLATTIRTTTKKLEDMLFLDLPSRLAKKLLELGAEHGQRTERGLEIGLHLTQSDLATMLGTTRVSINKIIGAYSDAGFIRVEKYQITILNEEGLRRRIVY